MAFVGEDDGSFSACLAQFLSATEAAFERSQATLTSMLEEMRELRAESRHICRAFEEGVLQDLAAFSEAFGKKDEILLESQQGGFVSPIPEPQNIDSEIEISTPPVLGKIRSHISPFVRRVQFTDLPTRTVDALREFAFDGSSRDTQLFDPGGIDCVKDCVGFFSYVHPVRLHLNPEVEQKTATARSYVFHQIEAYDTKELQATSVFKLAAYEVQVQSRASHVWKPGGLVYLQSQLIWVARADEVNVMQLKSTAGIDKELATQKFDKKILQPEYLPNKKKQMKCLKSWRFKFKHWPRRTKVYTTCLTLSRVVNDSIMRGMVTAIESESAEKIAQKDLELSRIQEILSLYHVSSEDSGAFESCLLRDKVFFDPPDGFAQGSLSTLKTVTRKQLVMLVEEPTSLRRYIHVNRAGATVDTLGLGNGSHEMGSKTVDKMLDSLKSILETGLKRKSETELPSSWQQEHDFQNEIESAVVTSFVRSLKDEYQQRLLEKEGEPGGNQSSFLGNIKEIAGLRQELEAIRKSLLDHEKGDIEAGEERDQKRVEKLQHKMSASLSSALDTNGKLLKDWEFKYRGIILLLFTAYLRRCKVHQRRKKQKVYKRMLTYLLLMEVLIWEYGREQKGTSELMLQELLQGMFHQIFDDRLLWECSAEGKEKLRFRSQVSTSLDHHLMEERDNVLLYIQRHLLQVQTQQKQNGKKSYKSRMFKYKQKISKTRAWTETQQFVVQGVSMFITSGEAGTLQSRDCGGRKEQGRSMQSKLLKNWKFKFKRRMLLLLEVYLPSLRVEVLQALSLYLAEAVSNKTLRSRSLEEGRFDTDIGLLRWAAVMKIVGPR